MQADITTPQEEPSNKSVRATKGPDIGSPVHIMQKEGTIPDQSESDADAGGSPAAQSPNYDNVGLHMPTVEIAVPKGTAGNLYKTTDRQGQTAGVQMTMPVQSPTGAQQQQVGAPHTCTCSICNRTRINTLDIYSYVKYAPQS